MEGWSTTDNVNVAAIVSTLGVPIKIETSNDVRTGQGWTNIEFPTAQVPYIRCKAPQGSGRAFVDKSILDLLKSGELAKTAPRHEALDGLRALVNRELILDWLKKGEACHLARVPNLDRSFYVKGDPPPSVVVAEEQFPTDNIKLVAALGVIGAPICKIVGSASNHTFYVGRWTFPLDGRAQDAHALSKQLLRERTLDKGHPLFWAYQALCNRERILDMIHNRNPKLLVRRKGSPNFASAIIQPVDNKAVMDRQLNSARKHSGIF